MKTTVLVSLAAIAVLGACGEKPQTAGGAKDAPAYSGTGKAYAAEGWKQGDKTSWEQQLRSRGQNGQNEYLRTVKTN